MADSKELNRLVRSWIIMNSPIEMSFLLTEMQPKIKTLKVSMREVKAPQSWILALVFRRLRKEVDAALE
ncbi:hypothetical protein EMIT0P74_190039 [Pseudomonas sp. IT-P74]